MFVVFVVGLDVWLVGLKFMHVTQGVQPIETLCTCLVITHFFAFALSIIIHITIYNAMPPIVFGPLDFF